MKAIKGDLQSIKKLQKQFVKAQQQIAKQEAIQQASLPNQSIPLSATDVAFFRQNMKGVTPLLDTNRIDRQNAPLKNPEFYQAKRQQAEGETHLPQPKRTKAPSTRKVSPKTPTIDAYTYLAQGMGQDILLKLKQLYWPVEATLDLHGNTLEQASTRFDRFVSTCIEHQIKCFLIIHGKGHGSTEGRSILKPKIAAWLRDIDAIAAFSPAPEKLGGEGALLVLSKKPS
ncbi:DNA mismatch repair protein MutS [Pelistega sp. NLN82]|uniref:DNA mismatch repair protein MutS n=1 Tax=Pelistega ratti TaxID=2652177 RepID=A0A6L9Y3L5_9BURK|nr:Smr/MutS family protein [Pelistega ratti]NEN74991.1 DNA mismatch repair protein MutS [Pelistega ratti]